MKKIFTILAEALKASASAGFCCACILSCSLLSPCGCDDDDDDIDDGDVQEMIIPTSIVDGVMVSAYEAEDPDSTEGISITYDENGFITGATVGLYDVDFEYVADTRASGRKLKLILAYFNWNDPERDYNGHTLTNTYSVKQQMTNMEYNTDGFLVRCLYKYEEHYYGDYVGADKEVYYEKEDEEDYIYMDLSYNTSGRLILITTSGTGTDTIYDSLTGEEESDRYSDDTSIQYNYTGGSLESITLTSDEGNDVMWTFGYEDSHANTYNKMTPQMADGISLGEYSILKLLATTGYLGNAGALLPTSMVDSAAIPSVVWTISYTFWDDNTVRKIRASNPDGVSYFNCSYYKLYDD